MIDSIFPINFSDSMMQDVWKCELFWFRKYCQKLTGRIHNSDLAAGTIFASACEIVRKSYHNENFSVDDAIEAGYNYILDAPDTGDTIKSNERLAMVLRKYFTKFRLDEGLVPAKLVDGTHAIEYTFEFDLGIPHPELPEKNLVYKGKLDGLYELYHLGNCVKRYVVDEKTTGSIKRIQGTKLIDLVLEEKLYHTRGQFLCLTKEHAVLTKQGWMSIQTIVENKDSTEIMCWNNGELLWEQPYSYIEQNYTGNLVNYSGQIEILGTPEHRQPVFNRKTKQYSTYTLDTIPLTSDKHQFICAGEYKKEGNITEERRAFIALLVAAQADGCWTKDATIAKMVWTFSKERKMDRLEQIFAILRLQYAKNTTLSDIYSTGSYTTYRLLDLDITKTLKELLGDKKEFSSWLLDFNTKELKTFLTELKYWDGYTSQGRDTYTSTNRNNIDWVQTIASLCGLHSNIQVNQNNKRNNSHSICYNLYFTDRIHKAVSRHKKTLFNFEGKVYCINVPSSYFLVKHKNKIMVTGNCYHWAARQLGVKTDASLIRKVPILKDFEPAFELEIPVTQFAIDRWAIATVAKIEELKDKYLYYKKNLIEIGKMPHTVFYPIYGDGCNAYSKPCMYMEGCMSKDGEDILGSSYVQMVWDSTNKIEVPMREYKKQVGL